ncbi:MAG TPA: hypothetical protein VEI97_02785 [bacterium]|nr:hypothetical protein [bacterium]
MTVDQFRVLREDRALWTFTYLLPGEERLVLHYGTVSPGGMATATYDRLTDGQPAFVCEVGPRIREPLFRVMGDSPSAFFAGLPGQSLGRYRSPEEWPHRPLFLLETPGVAGGERYVMACGGDPDDGELSPEEEQLQREVNALKRFVQAHAKRPDTSTNSTPRQRRPRSSPGSTAGTTSGLATDLGVRK